MTRTSPAAIALLGAAILLAAFAQPGPDRAPQSRAELAVRLADYFDIADGDDSGGVTWAELQESQDAVDDRYAMGQNNFRIWLVDKLDVDRDGALTHADFNGTARAPAWPSHPYGGDAVANQAWQLVVAGQAPAIGTSRDWFTQADRDKDGRLSLAEASAGALAMFDSIDLDHDGTISLAERDAARAKWTGGGHS
ncbi:EF-hand domain-containing protein [Rhizorhabdus argentea]|uniref:EF-hand domain-containing protein n=1 Tax=Rhizorhabdus argentea TaxID=1387174 RepID=UPI0030EDFAF3